VAKGDHEHLVDPDVTFAPPRPNDGPGDEKQRARDRDRLPEDQVDLHPGRRIARPARYRLEQWSGHPPDQDEGNERERERTHGRPNVDRQRPLGRDRDVGSKRRAELGGCDSHGQPLLYVFSPFRKYERFWTSRGNVCAWVAKSCAGML
jgi:hypothetical protein